MRDFQEPPRRQVEQPQEGSSDDPLVTSGWIRADLGGVSRKTLTRLETDPALHWPQPVFFGKMKRYSKVGYLAAKQRLLKGARKSHPRLADKATKATTMKAARKKPRR